MVPCRCSGDGTDPSSCMDTRLRPFTRYVTSSGLPSKVCVFKSRWPGKPPHHGWRLTSVVWRRDRGITMLVRVDISASTDGVLSVALSHQPTGFAPYRIDNCTAVTLHLRQVHPAPRCSPLHSHDERSSLVTASCSSTPLRLVVSYILRCWNPGMLEIWHAGIAVPSSVYTARLALSGVSAPARRGVSMLRMCCGRIQPWTMRGTSRVCRTPCCWSCQAPAALGNFSLTR